MAPAQAMGEEKRVQPHVKRARPIQSSLRNFWERVCSTDFRRRKKMASKRLMADRGRLIQPLAICQLEVRQTNTL